MSHLSDNDSISFGQSERKSFFRRMSPRVIIYPIIIIVIVMFMMKHGELAKQAEREKRQEQQQKPLPKLDPMKPAALVSADAPLFPQLVFYYEQDFKEKEMMERLQEKHHKVCAIFAVDVTKNPDLLEKNPERTTPFAVFSKPDGVNITTQTLMDYEFYDAMLSSLNKSAEPKPQTAPPAADN